MDYKYHIKRRLDNLPKHQYASVKNNIIIALKKTRRTFDRYINIKKADHNDIPTKDLDIIALFLDCTPDELKNYNVGEDQNVLKLRPRPNKVDIKQG